MTSLTVREVADHLRVKPETVRQAIHAGELQAYAIGRGWKIDEAEFRRWLESKRVEPKAEEAEAW